MTHPGEVDSNRKYWKTFGRDVGSFGFAFFLTSSIALLLEAGIYQRGLVASSQGSILAVLLSILAGLLFWRAGHLGWFDIGIGLGALFTSELLPIYRSAPYAVLTPIVGIVLSLGVAHGIVYGKRRMFNRRRIDVMDGETGATLLQKRLIRGEITSTEYDEIVARVPDVGFRKQNE